MHVCCCVSHMLFWAMIDFSNILTKSAIEGLAEADEYEVVREVQVCPLIRIFHPAI